MYKLLNTELFHIYLQNKYIEQSYNFPANGEYQQRPQQGKFDHGISYVSHFYIK